MLIGNVISLIIVANLVIAYQPDNQVKNAYEEAYIGDNVYSENGAYQVAGQLVEPLDTAVYHIRIQNDGSNRDSFNFIAYYDPYDPGGAGPDDPIAIRYYDALVGGNDITDELWFPRTRYPALGTGWSTGLILPGNSRDIRCEIWVADTMPPPMFKNRNLASSYAGHLVVDMVRCSLYVDQTRPDCEIASTIKLQSFVGSNIYSVDGTNQTKKEWTTPTQTTRFYRVRIGNDGYQPDQFKITGTPGDGNWTVRYFDSDNLFGGEDITSQVTGEGWMTQEFQPADPLRAYLRLEVTPPPSLQEGSYDVLVTAASEADPSQIDVVKAETVKSYYRPDNLISHFYDSLYCGDDIYNRDGTNQTLIQLIQKQATFFVNVTNDGNYYERYIIKGTEPSPGWEVTYVYQECTAWKDVTEDFLGNGFETMPTHQVNKFFFKVTLQIQDSTIADSTCSVLVTSISEIDETAIDVVKAVAVLGETGVEESEVYGPMTLKVSQVFEPRKRIEYSIPVKDDISLAIYDASGKKVKELVRGTESAGSHSVIWEPAGYATGVYFCRLETAQGSATRKLLILD